MWGWCNFDSYFIWSGQLLQLKHKMHNQINHLLFLHSDDIIRLLEQNGRLLHKFGHFVLMKSSEVRKAGDQPNYQGWLRDQLQQPGF